MYGWGALISHNTYIKYKWLNHLRNEVIMDNYTPDPFWNNNQNDVQNNVQNDIQNNNQDSAGNNNSTPGYGSYSDNYSNNPNQPYNNDNNNANSSNNSNVYGNSGNSYNNGYGYGNTGSNYPNGNVYGNSGNSYNNGYNNNYNNGYNNNGYSNNSYNSYNNGYNNGYNNNGNYYGGNGNQQNNCPNFTLMLVFCILSILFLSKIVGAIALVFLFQANNNFRYGFYDKYESNIKICKILLVVSVVVGIVVFIGSMAIGFSTSLFSMM